MPNMTGRKTDNWDIIGSSSSAASGPMLSLFTKYSLTNYSCRCYQRDRSESEIETNEIKHKIQQNKNLSMSSTIV